MSMKRLADLVSDWGGFELLVAQLHETGQVSVEHNITLMGRSGAPRQIDVLVRHREGLYEHLIVVECKYRNSPVERLHVDALATTIREVGAARGVIFSVEGFQSGAVEQAKHENISLFRVREPTDQEWGLPGRHIDLWLQVISLGLGPPSFPNARAIAFAPTPPINLELVLGYPEHGSRTPARVSGSEETTLEAIVEKLARVSAREAYQPVRLNFGDDTWNGVVRSVCDVHFGGEKPIEVRLPTALVYLPEFHFRLGVRVDQSRIQIDRAEPYAFALAVEDCVQGAVSTAARKRGELQTKVMPVSESAADPADILQNGSIALVWAGPFVPWAEFDGIEPAKGEHRRLSLKAANLS